MWYRITLQVSGKKVMSGIRYGEDEDDYRMTLRVLETAKSLYGINRVRAVDITVLPEAHPEVQAILKSGKGIPYLKVLA